MSLFKVSDNQQIRTIQMNRGSSNPINGDFIKELTTIFQTTKNDDSVKGVLLTGKEHFFSVGFDLIELYNCSPDQYETFWEIFNGMIYELVVFDKPLVAGITGHAPAGGCVLSLCADYRVMAEGKYKIGLNEIPVGIIVPPSIFQLYVNVLGKRLASQFILEGKLHTVDEALKIGLIDESAPLDEVNERALIKLRTYLQFNQDAWRITKMNGRSELIEWIKPKKDENFSNALKQWWKPEVRAALKTYIDGFKSKK